MIDPGNGKYPTECCPNSGTPRVEFNAEWVILKGFEIRYGWEGIKIYKGHNTIQDNWIHHNKNAGVIIVSTDNILLVGNTIEKNGIDPVACPSGKNCHGIYMSDYLCTGMSDITIKRNVISDHPGRGIQWNGEDCSDTVMQGTLVENNLIENNSWGMVMFYNVKRSVVRNNTVVIQSYPTTNEEYHTFVGIYGSSDNIFKNNIFYTTRSDVEGLIVEDGTSKQNTFDYNLWKVVSNSWHWGSGRSDFISNYKSATGWDKNGSFADPKFSSVANGMYYLNPDSPAIDRGQDSECASTDIDLELRLESGNRCDIGMDEAN